MFIVHVFAFVVYCSSILLQGIEPGFPGFDLKKIECVKFYQDSGISYLNVGVLNPNPEYLKSLAVRFTCASSHC